MANADLSKINDDLSGNNSSEGNGGLVPNFDKASNKAFIEARGFNDTASNTLPEITVDFFSHSDGPEPGDKAGTPVAGENKGSEKPGEQTVTGASNDAKITTSLKLGGAEIPISLRVGEEFTVRRGKDGVPENSGVSRNHAVIGRDEKGLYVTDLNSTNGTFVYRGGSETGERLLAGQKLYLADVDAVQFSRQGPLVEGGKAAQVKAEKAAPKVNDTVVAAAPPDVRPVPDYAGKEVPHPDHWQRELTHGKMIGEPKLMPSTGEREEYRAKIMVDGKETEVILRHFNNRDAVEHTRKEIAAYELNQILGLDAKYGATSIREFEVNGVKKLGSVRLAEPANNLETELRGMAEKKYGNTSDESVKKLIESDPKLKSALEKAFAERAVLGEKNFQVKDFVIAQSNGEYRVTSRKMEASFDSNAQPTVELKRGDTLSAQVQSVFSEKAVSADVKAKLEAFLEKYNNRDGYEHLKEAGLTRKEIDFMMARAMQLTDKGTFPKGSTGGIPGEGGVTLTDATKYNLNVARNAAEPGMELRTTEQVADHLQRVHDHLRAKRRISESNSKDMQEVINEYKAGNPKVMQAVNKVLALNIEAPVSSVVVDSGSVKDLERAAQAPEQRAGYSTEKVLENGAIRNLLTESGVKEERARELEKELTSKDKEVQKRAAAEIDKAYASRGGYKTFVADARGRLGAVAVTAAAVIPQLLDLDRK